MTLFNAFDYSLQSHIALDYENCTDSDEDFPVKMDACGCCSTVCEPSIGTSYPAIAGFDVCCKCCCQTLLNWLQLLCQMTGPGGFTQNFSLWSSSYGRTSGISGNAGMPRCGWSSVVPLTGGVPLTNDVDAYGNKANKYAIVMGQDPANGCKFTLTCTSIFFGLPTPPICNDTCVINTTSCYDCTTGLPLVFAFTGCLAGYTVTVGLDIPGVGTAVEQCGEYVVPMPMRMAAEAPKKKCNCGPKLTTDPSITKRMLQEARKHGFRT